MQEVALPQDTEAKPAPLETTCGEANRRVEAGGVATEEGGTVALVVFVVAVPDVAGVPPQPVTATVRAAIVNHRPAAAGRISTHRHTDSAASSDGPLYEEFGDDLVHPDVAVAQRIPLI
jgi:hypothetical protein